MQELISKKQVLEEQRENIVFKMQKLEIQLKGLDKSLAKLNSKIQNFSSEEQVSADVFEKTSKETVSN